MAAFLREISIGAQSAGDSRPDGGVTFALEEAPAIPCNSGGPASPTALSSIKDTIPAAPTLTRGLTKQVGPERRKFTGLLAQLHQAHLEEVDFLKAELGKVHDELNAYTQAMAHQAMRLEPGDDSGRLLLEAVTEEFYRNNGAEEGSSGSNSHVTQTSNKSNKSKSSNKSSQKKADGALAPADSQKGSNLGGIERSSETSMRGALSKSLAVGNAATSKSSAIFWVPPEPSIRSTDGRVAKFFSNIKKLVLHPGFETTFAVLICHGNGDAAGWVSLGFSASLPWGEQAGLGRSSSQSFSVVEWIFGFIFTIELILKVLGLRKSFFRDFFNWLDLVIVLIWLVSRIDAEVMPVNTMLLRLARLTRLCRLMRLVRQIQAFDALFLMTTALVGSVSILGWAMILLFILQMFLALVLTELLSQSYLSEPHHSEADRQEVYEYFGTFTRSMLSMFEITLANWPPVCRLLSERVTEWFVLFAVLHKLTIGFAVVGVINGVFMQETFKVAATDDALMVRQKHTAIRLHERKMQGFFEAADTSGDGFLSAEEFKEVLARVEVQTWLASMELDAKDVDNVFNLLDEGSGLVSMRQLIEGVARLKGTARSIDLVNLMVLFNHLQDTLLQAVAAGSLGGGHPQTMMTAHHSGDNTQRLMSPLTSNWNSCRDVQVSHRLPASERSAQQVQMQLQHSSATPKPQPQRLPSSEAADEEDPHDRTSSQRFQRQMLFDRGERKLSALVTKVTDLARQSSMPESVESMVGSYDSAKEQSPAGVHTSTAPITLGATSDLGARGARGSGASGGRGRGGAAVEEGEAAYSSASSERPTLRAVESATVGFGNKRSKAPTKQMRI
eukprot:CAMPEP_0178420706 /NCGR_PEP_ID=MMETSP0689_2-20121128/26270_1 /TAXON_ID=160604 /ORGANISM="Amphidinium massartii, Strain CS-259" /LENGTH=841 /DNA_ID=CAMNT_0020042195 /DNA_START=73 /DNA_END=2597 /DNA_ORIENTATION=-